MCYFTAHFSLNIAIIAVLHFLLFFMHVISQVNYCKMNIVVICDIINAVS